MTPFERKQQRLKFKNWVKRVKRRIPTIAIKFYEWKLKTSPSDSYVEVYERQLGRIIEAINNPWYAIAERGKPLTEVDEITLQVMLEIDVEEICKFVYQNYDSK